MRAAGLSTAMSIAAALYHDIMKAVVFQWREDGTLLDELTIAGTGAQYPSGAEAIVHGHPAVRANALPRTLRPPAMRQGVETVPRAAIRSPASTRSPRVWLRTQRHKLAGVALLEASSVT